MSPPSSQAASVKTPGAQEIEAALRRHVIDAWFPRCLDLEHGGFLCDFDRVWKSCGPHDKLLEFQARTTWFAAEALRIMPADERLRRALAHGFRYLSETLWDARAGGWFHRLSRAAGEPLEGACKHIHGMGYAIEACVAVYEATDDAAALNLAREAFGWVDRHAHDDIHGGYFGFLKPDGTIIRQVPDSPLRSALDPIGTPVGLKDLNVHSDLLEAFTRLYRVWPDPNVAERLRELVRIISSKVMTDAGTIFFLFQPNWSAVPHVMRYIYAFQTACRLLEARDLLDDPERIVATARRLVDASLPIAWDRKVGGIFFAGPALPPFDLEGYDLVVRSKSWWGQFEVLKQMLSLSVAVTDGGEYLRHFAVQWRYLQDFVFDHRYGGTYTNGLDRLRRRHRLLGARFAPAAYTRKGSVWKDPSHEGSSLLRCLALLRDHSRPGTAAAA